MAGARTSWRGDAALLVAVAVAYLLVRVAWAPTGGWARGHLTDVLAGLALPSLAALAAGASPEWAGWVRTLRGKLSLTGGAALVWEGVMPLLLDGWTADPLDVLAYLLGTLAHHGATRLIATPRAAAGR